MPKQIGKRRQARGHSPSLDGRIDVLRRRRRALTHVIDSFTAYLHSAGHESDLTDLCRLRNRPGHVPGHVPCGDLASTRRLGNCQEKERQPMLWDSSCGTSWEMDYDPSQGKTKRKDNMRDVLLYTTQPVLALGLAAALEESNCRLARVCSGMPGVREALARTRFGVLLIEATPELSTEMLSDIKSAAQGAPIVIWVDPVSTEFVAQALSLGVRGVLRKSLSLNLQVRCLEKVGSGELWVEKEMVASLLCTKRIVLGERERQLVTLLAQGLKNKEIGHRLRLSEGTVKVYLSRMFQKVGASDRFALALYAIENVLDNRCSSAGSEVPARPIASATRIPGALLMPDAGVTQHRLGAL